LGTTSKVGCKNTTSFHLGKPFLKNIYNFFGHNNYHKITIYDIIENPFFYVKYFPLLKWKIFHKAFSFYTFAGQFKNEKCSIKI